MTRYLKFCLVFLMFAVPAIGFIITDNNTVVKGENRVINQFPKEYSDNFYSQLVKLSLLNYSLCQKIVCLPLIKSLAEEKSRFDFN